jgi:tetratricopeptide (TPR) repeat protein
VNGSSDFKILLILFLFLTAYSLTFAHVKTYREGLRKGEPLLYLPPEEVIQIISLDYKSLVSKLIFFRAIVYFGDKLETKIMPNWHWIHKAMYTSVYLDPYNIDSYYFAEAVLTWDAKMIKEANELLERGLKYRGWDWYIPFFIGFNYLYFLKDNQRAAPYYKRAAELEPSVAPLAAKVYYKINETPFAIAFLKKMHEDAQNENVRKSISIRLDALEKIFFLEKTVNQYKDAFHKMPESLDELIKAGVIEKLPQDPYGGNFFLDKNGQIKTTSNLNFPSKK